MYDVVSIGELLIDFTPHGQSDKGNQLYEANPGGAPANFLAVLARLGLNTAFIGKIGADAFGNFLTDRLRQLGVDPAGIVQSETENTTLAFVHLDESGDRSFSFYRKPGADMMLQEDEVNTGLIESARVVHFGGVSLSKEPARTTTLSAARFARDNGKLVTYDPNLRPLLWSSVDEAKLYLSKGLEYADIAKISHDELEFIVGKEDITEGTRRLQEEYPNLKLILVTMGERGCYWRRGQEEDFIPGYRVKTVDTTGAGDSFFGAFVYRLLESGSLLMDLTREQLNEFARFANLVGALVTTKKGAMEVMPTLDEIQEFGKDNMHA